MNRYLFQGLVLTPARSLDPGTVLVEGGRVAWVRAGAHRVPGAELLSLAMLGRRRSRGLRISGPNRSTCALQR